MDKGMEHRRISPKKKLYLPTPIICICRQVIYPHLSRVCCFLHCSSIGIHLSNPFSLSPSYSVMNGDGKKYLVMDGDVKRDGASSDFSQKEIVFSNSNHLHLQSGDLSTFVRVSTEHRPAATPQTGTPRPPHMCHKCLCKTP